MKNSMQKSKFMLFLLAFFSFFLIAISNYLVQLPLILGQVKTTYGSFSYPIIFLITDITIRIYGASFARKILFLVMLPALIASYCISLVFFGGHYVGFNNIFMPNIFVLRIVIASISAYIFGQLLDIFVFNKLRASSKWWLAPMFSTIFGTLLDSIIFFSIAFVYSSNIFMANNWVEIALIDSVIKIIVSIFIMLPAYRTVVNYCLKS
jgi:uncharacterized integral membrane protein (TIGR00697 family)